MSTVEAVLYTGYRTASILLMLVTPRGPCLETPGSNTSKGPENLKSQYMVVR